MEGRPGANAEATSSRMAVSTVNDCDSWESSSWTVGMEPPKERRRYATRAGTVNESRSVNVSKLARKIQGQQEHGYSWAQLHFHRGRDEAHSLGCPSIKRSGQLVRRRPQIG